MQKKEITPKDKATEMAARIKRTAILTGFSRRTVQRVIKGDQVNEHVMNVYMQITEIEEATDDVLIKTSLIKKVEEAVPFN